MNRIETRNRICHIILDNIPHNYLTSPEFISFEELEKSVAKQNCKAIIVHGTGRHFSAGADRETIHTLTQNGSLALEMKKGKTLLQKLKTFQIPILACIEGVCFGGGLEIALNADIRIASEKALFAFPEVNSELMPGLGGSITLSKQNGRALALEMLLGGDTLSAENALKIGLIDQICSPKTSLEEGEKLVNKLTHDRSIEIIHAVVESVRNAETLPYEDALKRETELFCMLAERIVHLK